MSEVATLEHVHVLATTPAEMETAQRGMVAWADRAVAVARSEAAEANAAIEAAKRSGMAVGNFVRRQTVARRKLAFYEKVKAALEAGYYIVPPFPVQLFAVRTDRGQPAGQPTTYRWQGFPQQPRALPAGEGRYVSPDPEIWSRGGKESQRDGTTKDVTVYYPKEFTEVEFPFALAKPQVIEATGRALASKIFDALGVLPTFRTRGDPIVVGQIKHYKQHKEPLTFFIAWWLDTAEL